MAIREWSRLPSRLARLTWNELRVRGAQALHKRADYLLSRIDGSLLRPGAAPGALGRFFFDANGCDAVLRWLRSRPDLVSSIVSRAERICRHQFDLLGYEGLDYGKDIDWHRDVASGRRAPRKPWYKIDFLDFAACGDVKVTWELNRHQHLVILAKAFRLTDDRRFLDELVAQWHGWDRQNPYPIGVNWASSLEVAFRALSWLWVRELLAGCSGVDADFRRGLDARLALSARHLERYLSTYFSPNTHLLGEAVALFFLGTLCAAADAPRWQKLGWEITLEQAQRQVQPDGFHFEQSTYYHVYALDFFLHARILAERNGVQVPKELDATLQRMLECLSTLAQAGPPPRFGDDDGGRLFDGQRNRPEHLLDPLATGAVLFSRPDFKRGEDCLPEETVWLLGPGAVERFAKLPCADDRLHSAALAGSGFHVMVEPATRAQLTIRAGQQGAMGGGHSHADALSLQLSAGGQELLTDAGTCVYVGPGNERRYFRGTGAHNTVQVDGLDQMEASGPFPWDSDAPVEVERWIERGGFALLSAKHLGYARLDPPVVHRRKVFQLGGRFWFVLDIVEGAGQHQVDVRWRLAPGLKWSPENSCGVGSGLDILPCIVAETGQGWAAAVMREAHSRIYGKREEAEILRFSRRSQLPVTFATVLKCVPGAGTEPGTLSNLDPESLRGGVALYRFREKDAVHHLFAAAHPGTWQWRTVASDADFLYYGEHRSGRQILVVCAATRLEIAGVAVDPSVLEQGGWSAAAVPSASSGGGAMTALRELLGCGDWEAKRI